MKPRKMLVISHDASLSGAPVLLLNLLGLLKKDPKIIYRIIVKRGGPMTQAFRELGPTLVLKSAGYMKNKNFIAKISDFAGAKVRLFCAIRWSVTCDFLFNNTITNGRIVRQLNLFRKPVITYVHELANVSAQLDRHGDIRLTLRDTSLFFCPSKAVSDFLGNAFSISPGKRKHLPYYFPFDSFKPEGDEGKALLRREFSLKFGLNPQSTWIVAMGTISERKGYDIFLETFILTEKQHPGLFSFVWIGSPDNESTARQLAKKLDSMKVKPVFTGSLPHSYSTLAAFDVFFSASREDPYPLVVLEAAFQKVPSICFKNSGGIQEFITDGAGWVIPAVSPELATELVASIKRDEIKQKGEKAFKKVMALHSDGTVILDKFYSGINEVLQNR